MRDLRLKIPDLTYAELTEIGRSLIPPNAPSWTDHNAHDPGIMLMELLASIADRQVYALSRTRRDERSAYARLMGITASRPIPATGLVWPGLERADSPTQPAPWPRGTIVDPGSSIRAALHDAPEFRVDRPVYLTTCKLVGVRAVGAGSTQDFTQLNRGGEAGYFPFGAAPDAAARLELDFARGDAQAAAQAVGTTVLSIGVRAAGERPGIATGRAALTATLEDTAGEREIDIVDDSTAAFTHGGAILVAIDASTMAVDDAFTLRFACRGGAWLAVPRVAKIAANVLPVTQRQNADWLDFAKALGIPDEELKSSVVDGGSPVADFAAAVDAIGVRVSEVDRLVGAIDVRLSEDGRFVDWTKRADFRDSGPNDRHVVIDRRTSTVRSGNGVNGRRFPAGAQVQVRLVTSRGARGNLAAGQAWTVQGILGTFGTNLDAMQGGIDAATELDLQIRARAKLRGERPLVSRSDLEEAAGKIEGIARAEELAPDAGGPRRLRGERRLVVVRRRETNEIALEMLEPRAWLRDVRRALAPRLPMGQGLEVLAPRYVPLRVRATLRAAPRVAIERVERAARRALLERFAILPAVGRARWPLGRHVSLTAVAGWLRKVEDVARVLDVVLSTDGAARGEPEIAIPRDGLPEYRFVDGDIRVEPADRGAA
jgi:hypothetical protein